MTSGIHVLRLTSSADVTSRRALRSDRCDVMQRSVSDVTKVELKKSENKVKNI